MAEHIARTVDAGTLAVPDREDAVILAFAEELGLLRTPAGRGGELLVEAGLEHDIRFLELPTGTPELLVEAAERRAAISRHEAGRPQPCEAVALALHHQHPDDRLRTGDEEAFLAEVVFVVERDVVKRHPGILLIDSLRQPHVRPAPSIVRRDWVEVNGKSPIRNNLERPRHPSTIGAGPTQRRQTRRKTFHQAHVQAPTMRRAAATRNPTRAR